MELWPSSCTYSKWCRGRWQMCLKSEWISILSDWFACGHARELCMYEEFYILAGEGEGGV